MTGDPFHDPEKRGIDLFLIIEGAERFRMNPFSVPRMEIFMRDKVQEAFVFLFLSESERGVLKAARIPVFQPSPEIGQGVQNLCMVLVGKKKKYGMVEPNQQKPRVCWVMNL